MKNYIGTKQIKAKPMTRAQYNEYRGWEMPLNENGNDEGYLVEYQDGYISWSPKIQFIEAYRETDNLTFGLAIEAMLKGKKVQRSGWNGKNMWLRYVDPYLDEQFIVTETESAEGTLLPWIGMKTANNEFVPWLASQTDILSQDWSIIE